jgi:hypothetical protein
MTETKAVILLESQPPHIGEISAIWSEIDNFDLMYICVDANVSIMPLPIVLKSWEILLKPYKNKVVLCATKEKFDEITVLPELFKGCTVLTTSSKVFVHLGSLNIPVKTVNRLTGYHGIFLRAAYRQGRALDWLQRKR